MPSERTDTARLTHTRRDDAHAPAASEPSADRRDDPAFVGAPTVADRARGLLGKDTVHDDLRDRNAGGFERVDPVHAFGKREFLGERDPVKGGPPRIAQQLPVPEPARRAGRSAIGRLRTADSCELFTDQPMLVLKEVEDLRDRCDGSGAASSRSVCPVGAVSTTIEASEITAELYLCPCAHALTARRAISRGHELVDAWNRQVEQRVDSPRSSHVPCSRISPIARRCSVSHRVNARGASVHRIEAGPSPGAGRADSRTPARRPANGPDR